MNRTELFPGVWHIEESYRVYCTAIVGERGAILFDTGLGRRSLRPAMAELTEGGFEVLCSHGHYDHVGGIRAFPNAWIHPADIALARRTDAITPLRPLAPGTRFPLGNLTVQVVALPGHTAGSVGLLIPEYRLLLAGDALGPRLLLPDLSRETLAGMRETLTLADHLPVDRLLASHNPGLLKKDLIRAHLLHAEELLAAGPPEGNRSRQKTPFGLSEFRAMPPEAGAKEGTSE